MYIKKIGLVVFALLSACGSRVQHNGGTDSNTHWLQVCDDDAECDETLSCICGLCTVECPADDHCAALAGDRPGLCATPACDEPGFAAACTLACNDESGCPGALTCSDGICIAAAPAPTPLTPPPASREIELDDFEARFWQATCDNQLACRIGNDPQVRLFLDTTERCLKAYVNTTEAKDIRSRVEAAKAGLFTYDTQRAATCVSQMSNSCGLVEQDEPYEGFHQFCSEVFDGPTPSGQACSEDVECAGDAFCTPHAERCTGTCRPRAKLGEVCDNTPCSQLGDSWPLSCNASEIPARCVAVTFGETRGLGEECAFDRVGSIVSVDELHACEPGLFCSAGVCQEPLEVGAACADWSTVCEEGAFCPSHRGSSAQCTTFNLRTEAGQACNSLTEACDLLAGLTCDYDTDTCIATLEGGALGTACLPDALYTCQAGLYCELEDAAGEQTEPRCEKHKPVGAACAGPDACESGLCESFVCAARYCAVSNE